MHSIRIDRMIDSTAIRSGRRFPVSFLHSHGKQT
nr:MAG TPA: hypothetical protein [Caudoviricetes sp.]